MEKLMISLLPPIVGASLGAPVWTVVTLLLLRGEGGLIKAGAFAMGAITVRLAQGIVFGTIFVSAEKAGGEAGPDLIASTLQLVVGIFLLVTAVTAWRIGDDPDAPPPKWMTLVRRISAPAAFGMGLVLMAISMKQWIFTLSAIATIEEAQLGVKRSVIAYLIFAIAAQWLMLALIVSKAVAPTQSAKIFEVMQDWLARRNKMIAMVASLTFGVWFLAKGMNGLLALGAERANINVFATAR
jgi:hypothetical protein